MHQLPKQLPLPIKLNKNYSLNNFHWAGNESVKDQLDHYLNSNDNQFLYLWGMSGSGKTHILQGIANTEHAIYLPLQDLKNFSIDLLDDLDYQKLILLDDIDEIYNIKDWQHGIFALFNKIFDDSNTKVIISNNVPPSESKLSLPDLKSRMFWSLVLQLQEMSDYNKSILLGKYANNLGINLSSQVIEYLLKNYDRNIANLLAIVDSLDQASLVAKRKITIPFIKNLL